MSKFVLSAEDRKEFEQIVNEGIQKEIEKGKQRPGRFTYEDTFKKYLTDTNDYEKFFILNKYRNTRNHELTTMGLSQISSVYETEMINNNYDAYELAKNEKIGDFDIKSVERDEDGNLVSATYIVHSDRWAFMSDSRYARDNKKKVTIQVNPLEVKFVA